MAKKKSKPLVHPKDRTKAMRLLITFARDLDALCETLPSALRKLLYSTASLALAMMSIRLGAPEWLAGAALAAHGGSSLAEGVLGVLDRATN